MRIRSVLVIPFADGIGDFVNMQPLLAVIRGRFPDAEITVAVSEHGGLLGNDPQIRTVKPAAFKHERAKQASNLRWLLPQTVLAWCAGPWLDRELGPFDLIVNCFYAWERAMDFRATWTPQVPPVPEVVHSLDCLADELERELTVAIPAEARKPHLVLRPAAQDWATAFMRAHDLDDGRPLVALVPGTNMAIKRWPLARWLDLDARLHAAAPEVRTLLFCDLPLDNSPVAAAFGAAGAAALPIHAPLDRVAALLARCNLAVSVDTGLLHMAAALDVRWVGLFGPTNPDVTGPYDPSLGEALIAPFAKPPACASCWKQAFKYEDDRCRALDSGSCMAHLAVRPVLTAALRALRAPARHPLVAGREPAHWPVPAPVPVGASPALGF